MADISCLKNSVQMVDRGGGRAPGIALSYLWAQTV